jgi:hypothetical protein
MVVRAALKTQWTKVRVGSSPTTPTKNLKEEIKCITINCFTWTI